MTHGENQPVSRWCDKHWRPYRERQANGIMASMAVVQRVVDDDRFRRECGYDPSTGRKADGSAETLNRVMAKLSPLCCFLGDEVMADILAETRKGRKDA